MSPSPHHKLFEIAKAGLEANIVKVGNGSFLSAGSNHFRGFWTRDFCLSVPALLKLGHKNVAAHHLNWLLDHTREKDGLVPRVIDSLDTRFRVPAALLRQKLQLSWPKFSVSDNLAPEYLGEHNTVAIDSNLFVLMSLLQLKEYDSNLDLFKIRAKTLKKILHFYAPYFSDGLIYQSRFADWQDSVDRSGRSFIVNLLYYVVVSRVSPLLDFEFDAEGFRARLYRKFFDTHSGLFRTHEQLPHIGLDGNLWAIEWGLVESEEKTTLYERLKSHSLWQTHGQPGYVTDRDYPGHWHSWTVQSVGLNHYHDRLYWSWLMALSAKVAHLCDDFIESKRLLNRLQSLAERDGAIGEIYQPNKDLTPFSSWAYQSESPFSWGSAKIVEAVLDMAHLGGATT
ncbi:MAG: hypothetical protein H6626_08195 [Pseudobdellovibrionaceae bacterium]|nr:hypothetical protein [Bdellovibrionales bacterium]USN46204.1 MAG: hypothetical protein H6626_08195 [Pseudobdellovibrionaceae bacterium]